jgi:hypothetical protein
MYICRCIYTHICTHMFFQDKSDKGLLGLSTLRSPSDFPALSKEAVNNCKILREEISRLTDPLETLLLMDQISNEVCI